MKEPRTTLTQYLWIFFAPFCWLLGLAITHELFSSQGYLRDGLVDVVSILSTEPSSQILSLAGLIFGGMSMFVLLWITHQQNQPTTQRAILKGFPELSEGCAAVCLLIGALILGSELDNVLNHMNGELSHQLQNDHADLEAWKEALRTPWGIVYELILLPFAECFIFHHIVQRCVPIKSEPFRIAFTALVMTTFSWRLSASPLLVNLCGAWLFERVRSTSLSLSYYFDFQLIGWVIAIGYGPQIEGFDLVTAPWQPWSFNLLGVCLLFLGIWLLERTLPFSEKRTAILWEELVKGELYSQSRSSKKHKDLSSEESNSDSSHTSEEDDP